MRLQVITLTLLLASCATQDERSTVVAVCPPCPTCAAPTAPQGATMGDMLRAYVATANSLRECRNAE